MKTWNNIKKASLLFFLVLVSSITITISAFAADSDSDGIEDNVDICPTISNPDQIDSNNDGIGDACTMYHCVANNDELQQALTIAETNNMYDYIMIEQGSYTASAVNDRMFSYISLYRPGYLEIYGISLAGGYKSDCSARDLNPENTVLFDENMSSSILTIVSTTGLSNSPVSRIVVEGLTLKSGIQGAGIDSSGEIVFSHNIVSDNKATTSTGDTGVELNGLGKIFVIDNVITRNSAYGWGGGLILSNYTGNLQNDVLLYGNVITDNSVDDVMCANCGNNALGGGIYIGTSQKAILINNVIAGNKSTSRYNVADGGGVYIECNNLTLTDNTITDNVASSPGIGSGGGGLFYVLENNGIANLYNNIIWGNTAYSYGDIYNYSYATTVTTTTNAFNNDYDPAKALLWQIGNTGNNINAYPMFVNSGARDYHLTSASPLINIGSNSAPSLPLEDFEGDLRITRNTTDIGADEYNPVTVSFSANPVKGLLPLTVNFTDQSSAVQGSIISWAWDFNSDGITDSTVKNPSYTYVNEGLYPVSLTVTDSSGYTNTRTKENYIEAGDAIDSDQDGIFDVLDNCRETYNPLQTDLDKDGIGDACDSNVDLLAYAGFTTGLKSATAKESSASDVTATMKDGKLDTGKRVALSSGKYNILSFRSNSEASGLSAVVLNLYASNLYKGLPTKARIYAYSADGASVQSTKYLDFTLTSGWNSINLASILHSMDNFGFVKFRVTSIKNWFEISEAYFTEMVDAQEISVSPSELNFSSIAVGTSKTLNLTVSNAGSSILRILNVISASAPFSITSNGCMGVTLSPSANCSITVSFTQISAGTFIDALRILSNDSDHPSVTIRLTAVQLHADLDGAVNDALSNYRLEDVKVIVTDPVGTYVTSTCSDKINPCPLPGVGAYNLCNLTAGDYTAKFELWGYAKKTVSGVLTPGQNSLDVQLISVPPLWLTITYPQNGAVVNSSPVTVSGSFNNNAQVVVNGITASVNNGNYSASIPLTDGQNVITATATDQYDWTTSRSINVTLVTRGSITGLVTDSSTGLPISSATVSVTDSLNVTKTALTGIDGIYTVTGVASGSFAGTIIKEGYALHSFSGTMAAGQTVTVNASLTLQPPTISDIIVSGISIDSAIVSWTTDQPASTLFEFGLTTAYGSSHSNPEFTTSQNVILTNLSPSSTYHFKIISTNSNGRSSSSGDNTFTTLTPQFTVSTLGDYGNVTVMEVSGNYDFSALDSSINAMARQEVAKEFLRTHQDTYDFLVIFSNFDFSMPDADAKAFYLEVKNDTQGIGKSLFDNSALFGSGKLQGIIEMGNISNHITNPADPDFEKTVATLAHEQMHRWGANVKFKDSSGNISTALLGKDGCHWSFLLDSDASVLYGNDWKDNGNGTFTSMGANKYYSPLDLYLMGMYDRSQIPPMLLIDYTAIDPKKMPEIGTTVTGTARLITIDDIIAAEGARIPDAPTSQKSFRMAYILITRPGTFTGSEPPGIENIRNAWAGKFAVLTEGKGTIEDVDLSITIEIASPVDGAAINRPDVTVTGYLINSTGNETGIVVNGSVATVTGNQFTATHVPLAEGSNTITATATDTDGNTATASTTVNALTTGNYIRLTSNIESGIAPLEATLRIDGSFSITASNLNITGPVQPEVLSSSLDEYTVKMGIEGIYYFTASATGPDGTVYQDAVVITVMNKTQLDNLLRAKWFQMKNYLANQDIQQALNYYIDDSKQFYNDIYTAFYDQLPQLAQEMQDIQLIYANNNTVKYRLRENELYGGTIETITYYIYFVIDKDGLWKIYRY